MERLGSKYVEDFQRINVPSHILASPVIADLDGDGRDEMVVPVSYYFEENEVDYTKYAGIKIEKYVAAGIVVFNLNKNSSIIRFVSNLDLTTDGSHYPGYLYSSPTVVDLDKDGEMEILVATGAGFVHVISSTGQVLSRKNFPLVMDSFFAPVAVANLDQTDFNLEIVAADTNSNIVCFGNMGDVIWETRGSGFPSGPMTIGDVDGNGELDVVVATSEGHVWAFNGKTGKVLENFPVKLRGQVMAQPLLVKLGQRSTALTIVVPALDGVVYFIHPTGCFDTVDVGEPSYSMVLAEDVTGEGRTQLLVTTQGGNVYLLGTQQDHHPLQSWTSSLQGRNNLVSRDSYRGVYVLDTSRQHRDVTGKTFIVQLEIVDRIHQDSRYDVKIKVAGMITNATFFVPGIYSIIVESPRDQISTCVQVEMINEFKEAYFDSYTVTFNQNFGRIYKWVVMVPFLGMVLFVMLFHPSGSPIPLEL